MSEINPIDETSVVVQVRETNALDTILKAEIDIQISTAKAYPRSLKDFKDKAVTMATLDIETAEGCFYALPRDGKTITGPSVRLAEIVLSAWGNIRAAAQVVANDGKQITARGMCHDLESNTSIAIEVKRSIKKKDGRTFSDDMQVVTGNAACAIALRNAIFKVIPMVYTRFIYNQTRKVAAGDKETLAIRVNKALEYFFNNGISNERVFLLLDTKGREDIDQSKLLDMIGIINAIRDGDTTLDEAFPQPAKKTESQEKSEAALKSTLSQINEKKANGNGNGKHKVPEVKMSDELKKLKDGVDFFTMRVKEANDANNSKLAAEMDSKLADKKNAYNKLAEKEGAPKL